MRKRIKMLKKEEANLSDYRIFETNEFQKQLQNIDHSSRRFIQKKLTHFVYVQLRKDPIYGNNIKILKDYNPKTWRYRIGKYRIFYSINFDNRIVNILTIDHRKDIYRK